MNISLLTLIGQSVTFAVFVWFCMKYIWPPIVNVLAARTKRIADGLEAGERGKQELVQAGKRSEEVLREGKERASGIIGQAEQRALQIIEEAKNVAKSEGERLIAGAKAEIAQEVSRAKETLRGQVSALAIAGAEKILRREVDAKAHAELLKAVELEL